MGLLVAKIKSLCDKDDNNVIDVNLRMFRNIIPWAIFCDLNIARRCMRAQENGSWQ